MASSSSSSSARPRPPITTRSSCSSSISSSSIAPSSPGPSVSLRSARSPAPLTQTGAGFLNARSPSSTSAAAGFLNHRSMSGMSSPSLSSVSSVGTARHHHSRRRPTLMGGGNTTRLGKSQLANLAAGNSNAAAVTVPVPPILVNGTERPEDVDISSIGRLPSTTTTTLRHTTTPESTSVGVDNLFTRFGVKDIRQISQRARLKADSKKDELRNMVGERYRDLLGAADSIVRMRKSSTTLLGKLGKARDECDRELMLSKAAEEDMTRSRLIQPLHNATSPDAHSPYSIATLVKLLLDCPEHIWRSIEKEDYLSAARLEGVGRAVYRELVSSGSGDDGRRKRKRDRSDIQGDDEGMQEVEESDEDEEEGDDLLQVFPLIQQSGDTLDQLGPQISHRANLHLRNWDVPATTTAHSLASIMMLDNISIPEALKTTLEQRTNTLVNLFEASTTLLAPTPRRPSVQPVLLSSASVPSAVTEDKEVKEVVKKTVEALGLILKTHEHARSIFVSEEDDGTNAKDPLLLGLLNLIQRLPSAAVPQEGSMAVVTSTPTSSTAAVNAILPILNTLPNAHLLLRYLPSQIVSFTPFVDTSSSRNILSPIQVNESLTEWMQKSLITLEEGLTKMFATLLSAKQLAQVSSTLHTFLSSSSSSLFSSSRSVTSTKEWQLPIDSLHQTLDRIFQSRFIEIYNLRLDNLSSSLYAILQNALSSLAESKEDLDPTLFLFSDSIPFPSTSAFSSSSNKSVKLTNVSGDEVDGINDDPFMVFKEAMQRRVNGRSPVLDSCLSGLERTALEIREDVTAWLGDSELSKSAKYREKVSLTLKEIREIFKKTLEEETEGMEQKLFIGALAQHIVLESTFVQDLLLDAHHRSTVPEEVAQALLAIEAGSLSEWRNAAIQGAVSTLRDALQESLGKPATSNPDKPSEHIYQSLYILMEAIRKLGPHRCQAAPQALQQLLQTFEERLLDTVFVDVDVVERVRDIPTGARRTAYVQQLQIDIRFLQEVLRNAMSPEESLHMGKWTKFEQELQELASPPTQLSYCCSQAFLRTQNLLAPLVSSSHRSAASSQDLNDDGIGIINHLMPFGTPATLTASENKLELSKPGPRFALLQISQTAA